MPTRKAFRVTVICVITGLLGAVTPAAHAALLTISGTVKTPAGSTIDGAIVSDGGQSDESGSDGIPGHYSLQELSFDTYRITASKQGMTSAVADVPLTATNSSATQDFTLFYQSTLQVPDPYLSTAQGPETLTATLRTWAPYPESCAKITDSRTGTVEAMTHVGVENGQQVWQYTPTLETGSTEGTFTLDGRVDDCSGSLIDTGAQPKTYFVDNSAPEIDLKSLVPAMLGHTIYSSQVIAATAIDHGSGVNPSSPILQIVQNGVQQNLDVSVSNISGGVRVRSEAALLTTGLIYTADLRISDRAGNQQHFSWDFKALEFGVEGTLARIETQGVPRGGDVWEFLPLLGVRSFNFQVGAPLHSGSGSAIQRVPLGAAVIEVAGVPVATPYDAGASADVLSGIDLFLGEPLSQQVKWQQVRLQPLSVSLPAGTESATLKLALSATTPVANTCMDPAVLPSGWLACSPDPFPFFVDEALAERMIQGKLQYFSKTGSALPGQGYVGALQRITRLDGYKVWQPVSLDGGVVSVAWEEQVISFIDGVGYFGTLDTWPVHPSQFEEACAERFFCTATVAVKQDRVRKCISKYGWDLWNAPEGECRQLTWFYESPPSPSDDHKIAAGGYIVLELGAHDAPKNEVGNAWDDGGSWQYLEGDAPIFDFAWREEDVYKKCNWEAGDPEPVFRNNALEGKGSVSPHINPYGVNTAHTAQWGTERTNCGTPLPNTYWRAVGYMWNTHFHTVRNAVQGTAVFSFGHVMRKTTHPYGWSIGVGVGVGAGSVSFSFSVSPPEETDRVKESEYPVGYCWGYQNCLS